MAEDRARGVAADTMQRGRRIAPTWALLGGVLCAAMARLEPNLLEEGVALHIAQRIAQGEHLYRDIVFFTGPLPFDLLAGLFRIFGEEIVVARAVVVGLHAASTGAVYAIARRAGAGALAHVAAAAMAAAPVLLFPLLSIYFYTTLALYGTVLASYAALRGTRSLIWAVAAGALVSCTALCKQTVGGALAAPLLLALVFGTAASGRMRHLGALAAGGLGVAALTLAISALRGDLGALVHSLAVMPFRFGSGFESPLVNFWPPGAFAPYIAANEAFYLPGIYGVLRDGYRGAGPAMILLTQLLYAAPFLVSIVTLVAALRIRLPTAAWVQAAALVALASNLFPRADWGHLVFSLPTALAQMALLGGVLLGPAARRLRWIAAAGVLVLLGGSLVVAVGLYQAASPPGYGPRVPQPGVGILARRPNLPHVIEYLRQRTVPGEPIFVARAEPLLYFATDTTNPTPYVGVIPGLREEQEAAILPALERLRFVVMSDIDSPIFNYYRDELPAVQSYLERHFRVPASFTGRNAAPFLVLERGDDRGETVIDLFEPGVGRAWVRDARGQISFLDAPPPRLATRQNRRPLPLRLGRGGGGVDFELDLPRGALFQGDAGMKAAYLGDRRLRHPTQARLVISLNADGRFKPVLSLRPALREMWSPLQLDLSRWGGSRVSLRIEIAPDSALEPGALAWIGSPRIARIPSAN